MAIYGRKTRDKCREAVIEAYEYCNKSDIVTYQPPFPRWYHIRRVNVGKFSIIRLFKPKTYHTNYDKTVPEKTIKIKRKRNNDNILC